MRSGGPLLFAALLSLAVGGSATAAAPSAHAAPLPIAAPAPNPAAASKPYSMNLYRRGDFVAQTNFVQCVGASMQMMLNMIEPTNTRTAREQFRLQNIARSGSPPRPDGRERQGASVYGWTAALNSEGGGPYRIEGADTLPDALRIAARAIRQTHRPVGLLMWRGRHAWVMSGFEATADPLLTDQFTVRRAVVLDPLYPYGSRVWGRSPRPGDALAPEQLGRQYKPRRSSNIGWLIYNGGIDLSGKYVLVLPYEVVPVARAAHRFAPTPI